VTVSGLSSAVELEAGAARTIAERGVQLIEYASDLNIFMAGAAWLRKEAKLS